jgi:hypothetical protein
MADDPDPPLPAVNAQILDAVGKSIGFVFAPNAGGAAGSSAGAAIAYQKVAQAAALAVQDATDYQRNILSISTVAQGKALALMFAEKKVDPYAEILQQAILASTSAVKIFGEIGAAAAAVAGNFPKS